MTVRPARDGDLPIVYQLARHFLAQTIYGPLLPVTDAQLESFVALVRTIGVVLLAERAGQVVGLIGLVATPHPINDAPECGEVAWWVEPAARKGRAGYYLLRSAEDWARQNGCGVLKMVAPKLPDQPSIAPLYAKLGYQEVETTFVKVL